ncbi:kelch-like protein 33 [Trichomycterus rosablanca]|uniref:kelch-like protein 33 n=1 Tax=Trichomycterus rosablanca TaxID=2290929 RepID=UPI002F35C00B
MEFTRRYLPMEWEERWRKEKERRKMVMEEGGERVEEENRRLQWIKAYNDCRIGVIKKEQPENSNSEILKMENENQWNKKQETKRFSRDTYPTEISQAMEEMKHCSILTDLTLITKNGENVYAHSLVLAAVSSVIQRLLCKKDAKKETEIVLHLDPEVSDLGISAVLEFAYTGTITGLNRQPLDEIQTAAKCLVAPQIVELCRKTEERKKNTDEQKKILDKSRIPDEEQMNANLQSMRKLWEERVGCDVKLEAEERIFHAHRVILSANSDYFRAMFSSGMRESKQSSVSLLFIGASELEALLHYCYTGDLFLDWGCIFDITSTALQFQFLPVLSLCLSYMQNQINIYNCLDVVQFAEAYMLKDLFDMAEDFIHIHFQEVVGTPVFLELPAQKLLDLLSHDSLCVTSELAVFRAVVAWIEADLVQRLPMAQKVMEVVRFPLMTFREFREVRAINLQMECHGDELCLYSSALKEFGFGSPEVHPRIHYPKDVLVVVGGDQANLDNGMRLPSKQLWFANSLCNGTGMVKNTEWRMLGEMPDKVRFRHGVGVIDGKLYVAGGCHYYAEKNTMKSAYRYDPSKNLWKKLSDMQEYRSNFIMVVRGDHLYAIGGDKELNTNLDSVEKYSPDTDTWSFTHLLDQPLSGHAAVVWDGEIFISGGFNCKFQCLVSMFLYHPEQGTTYLADMTHDRAQHCMETLADRFYVAGGVSNFEKFYTDQLSCESYDPISDSWTAFTPLPLSHVGGASAVQEEKFYILGGYCQEDYSENRLIHRYNPGTQRWETMGKLAGPVTDIRGCLLHISDHLRK